MNREEEGVNHIRRSKQWEQVRFRLLNFVIALELRFFVTLDSIEIKLVNISKLF